MNETDECCGIDTEWQSKSSPRVPNRKMDDIPSKSLSTEFHPITVTKNEDCREGKYNNHSFLLTSPGWYSHLKPVSQVGHGCLSCSIWPFLPVHFESHVSDLSDSLEKPSTHSSLHISAQSLCYFWGKRGISFLYCKETYISSTWDLWHPIPPVSLGISESCPILTPPNSV